MKGDFVIGRVECTEVKEVKGIYAVGRELAQEPKVRSHYCREPCNFTRERESKTKDMAKEKGQSSQMYLMADVTERNWIDSWPKTTQTNVEGRLNIGDT